MAEMIFARLASQRKMSGLSRGQVRHIVADAMVLPLDCIQAASRTRLSTADLRLV